MAAVHGKNAFLSITDTTGTAQVISSYSRSAASTETIDVADTSNFGQNDKTYVIGMADEKFTIGGTFDPTFLTLVRGIKAGIQNGTIANTTVVYGPAGNTVGNYKSTRAAIITSIAVTASTTEVVTMSVEFQRTGPTTDGNF